MKQLFYICLSVVFIAACSQSGKVETIDTGKTADWNTTGSVTLDSEGMKLLGSDASACTKVPVKNFELELECLTSDHAIGAIYFHSGGANKGNTGYEVLINNNESPAEWRKTGSLSTVRNFAVRTAENNTWVPVKIEVSGKQIRIWVNGVFVTDYTEPGKPYREPANAGRVLSKGVFVLANLSDTPIEFRNVRLKKLPDDGVSQSEAIDEQTDEIIRLQQQNFPVIDCHLHLKGGWTKEQAAERSRKYGITYGIAPNCGKNFPITDDAGSYAWIDSMKHQPFLLPMQAEGREWLDMFSRKAMDAFDYRFTDAMTWTDHKGRRMRIWILEETFVDDKQQFMDMLVERACGIISNEPIHIYVNPTFIPEQMMPEYDALWTSERMQKIIDACVKSNVAIEINNRYRIPSETFIKMAKKSGAKFTFGTNNTSTEDVGKLEYSIEMIKACGLIPEDLLIPYSKNI
ncbi:MAG: DUF1080 domain-containing protein [Dysgonamonadaceae bacterium]|nr:DUF1080 domain-containing protein [Dysgonamonadaceae bacterium]